MGQITFPVQSGPDPVTVESADVASLEAAGGITVVTMKDGAIWRSPAPLELLQQAVATGDQPVEPLPPTQPAALAASVWKPGG